MPVGDIFAQPTLADGSLVRAEGDVKVYAITNGRKRHILDERIFYSYGWRMADVQLVSPVVLSEIPPVRVVKTPDDPGVFDIQTGTRAPFTSAESFFAAGFSFDEVALVNNMELEAYPLVTAAAETPTSDTLVAESQAEPEPLLLQKIAAAKELLQTAPLVYPQEKRTAWRKPLTKGARGPDVELLQETLQRLGHFPKTTETNGIFGPTTFDAVKSFQASQGIIQNGTVGPQTTAALRKAGLALDGDTVVMETWHETVPADRTVLLVAWNEATDTLALVRVDLDYETKDGVPTRATPRVISKTPGFSVRYQSGNGVNIQYAVTAPTGYRVLANRFPIFDESIGERGTFPPTEEIYVPFGTELATTEIIQSGKQYLEGVVDAALDDLRTRAVRSVSGKGLVADFADSVELQNIIIIEHVDVSEFRNTPDKSRAVNKVLSVLAINRGEAYRFAGSRAGALGLAQFIRNTYLNIVKRYPSAELIPDFEDGMADHVNAVKAMALYNDTTDAALETYVRETMAVEPAEFASIMAEVRAAAYNGGASRVKKAIGKFGTDWYTATSSQYGLRAETKAYLEKFRAVQEVLTSLHIASTSQ